MIENFLDSIGFFGPVILLLLSFLKLVKQKPYLIGYLVCYFINDSINQIVKINIKQLRPQDGKTFIGEPYVGADKYGMPSRHAQSMLFSTTFLFMVTGDIKILLFEFCLCALTIYQRWKYKQHTVEQLAVGAFIGTITAYFSYFLTNKYIISNV
jgi:membrane-associated phospholipid phosphatase